MGKKDIATTSYMKQSKIFADAFNFLLYDGEQRTGMDRYRCMICFVIRIMRYWHMYRIIRSI